MVYPRVARDIGLAEISNAPWKNVGLNRVTDPVALQTVRETPQFFGKFGAARDLMAEAFELTRAIDHRVCDRLCIIACRRADAPLVTTDRAMLAKLQGTPDAIRAIELTRFLP